jgi:hypothetical protein
MVNAKSFQEAAIVPWRHNRAHRREGGGDGLGPERNKANVHAAHVENAPAGSSWG